MKKFLLFLFIITMVLTLSACGTSSPEEQSESEMEEQADTVQTEVRKPVSDVVGGDGIQGTWKAEMKEDGLENEVILALNSNNTFTIYYGELESSQKDTGGSSADSFEGTYNDNKTNLELTPNQVDDATTYPLGEGSYPYTLEQNKLTIKDSQGNDIVFTRDENN